MLILSFNCCKLLTSSLDNFTLLVLLFLTNIFALKLSYDTSIYQFQLQWQTSYPLKLIFLLKRLKRFHFFERHSWGLAEVCVIWSGCKIVARNVIQEKASKLLSTQETALGAELFLLRRTASTVPPVPERGCGLLHGPGSSLPSPVVRQDRGQADAVRVTEITLLLPNSPLHFLFIGSASWRICRSWA